MSSRDLGQLSERANLVAFNTRDPFGVTPQILNGSRTFSTTKFASSPSRTKFRDDTFLLRYNDKFLTLVQFESDPNGTKLSDVVPGYRAT
jgi:hypothetical protein